MLVFPMAMACPGKLQELWLVILSPVKFRAPIKSGCVGLMLPGYCKRHWLRKVGILNTAGHFSIHWKITTKPPSLLLMKRVWQEDSQIRLLAVFVITSI